MFGCVMMVGPTATCSIT